MWSTIGRPEGNFSQVKCRSKVFKNYLGGLGMHKLRILLKNFISVKVLSGNRNHISTLSRKKEYKDICKRRLVIKRKLLKESSKQSRICRCRKAATTGWLRKSR